MRSHENTILIDQSILHTLHMVQNFNLLKDIKKEVGSFLPFRGHSILLGDLTYFRNIYVSALKINLHESIFKHTTYIECKKGEYPSMIKESSFIDIKASKSQKYVFKIFQRKKASTNKTMTCAPPIMGFVCLFLVRWFIH